MSTPHNPNDRKLSLYRGALQRHIVINAVRVSLFVGLCLNVVNQGVAFWHGGDFDWGKGLLNFIVPYLVASYSAVKAERLRKG